MKKINIPITETFLLRVAELIIEKHKSSESNDFSNDIVVLPGSRAGRRLLELLCENATKSTSLFSPPQFLTPGKFCELLIETDNLATDIEEIFAWNLALQTENNALNILMNRTVSENFNFFPLSITIRQIYNELAGDLIFFDDVVKIVAENEREVERWTALSQIYNSYLEILNSKKLTDKATAINKFLVSDNKIKNLKNFNSLDNIFVVGIVDMFARFRATINSLQEKVTIFSYGIVDWFDDEGGLMPDISFECLDKNVLEKIKFSGTVSDQAKDVVNFLNELELDYSCRDIIISAPDENIRQPLQQQLTNSKLKSHDSIGNIFSQSELGILLKTISDYLNEKSVKNFLKIIYHPAIQNFVFDDNNQFSDFTKNLIKFASDHVIDEIESEMFNKNSELKEKIEEVESLFSTFNKKTTTKICVEKINNVLVKIYEKINPITSDNYLNSLENQPSFHLDAIKKWNELSDRILSSAIEIKDKKNVAQTIKIMLLLLASEKLAPETETDTIDLLGWLEVPLDDAPVVILTGMNEGIVPESQTSHLFLPNSLRTKLGVQNNSKRFNRDRYYLRTIIESAENFLITAGKFSAAQDPLLPSRLLLDVSEIEQAKLLQKFCKMKIEKVQEISSINFSNCKISSDENIFLSEKATELAVTKFKTYLNCPYQFYLKQEKKFPSDELHRELPAYEFGNIVHKVLEIFGESQLSNSENFHEIQTFLKKLVDDEIEKRFGKNPHPAILLQTDSMISRLNVFAFKQVEIAKLGWEIVDTEKKFEFELDGYKINGKIDRIDKLHTQKFIIDYKTGKVHGENIHRDHYNSKKEKWIDLQLPLYAFWGREIFNKLPEVGYFAISKKTSEIGLFKYKLDDATIDDAIKTAKEIFEKINSNDKDIFKRTDDYKNCIYCDYKKLCNRDAEAKY